MTVIHLLGDVREQLATLPDDHFDCVVTSPPYWGLRDYGVEGQIGMEPTLGEHLDVMVEVCREIWRVLKPEGTFWLNYGDCYAAQPNGRSAAQYKADGSDDRTFRDKPFSTIGPINKSKRMERGSGRWGGGNNSAGPICAEGPPSTATRGPSSLNKQTAQPPSKRIFAGGVLKPKDLVMVPNRLAIALQEDGWWVRSEIIWAKPNPMPESIKDRPATAHEKIFLLTKSAKYFYEAGEVKVPASKNTNPRASRANLSIEAEHRAQGGGTTTGPMRGVVEASGRKLGDEGQSLVGSKPSREAAMSLPVDARNLRNWEPEPMQVWKMSTRAFTGAHFATFPPELVERCLKAGCPKGGHVLDPFGGAGTTGLVADQMQIDATLIELNPEYRDISIERIEQDQGPLFADPRQTEAFG